MSDAKTPRKSVMFVGHHVLQVNRAMVKDLLHQLRPGSVSDETNEPPTDIEIEEQISRWDDEPQPINFRCYYPAPLRPKELFRSPATIELVVAVRTFPTVELENRQQARIPLYEREKDAWYEVVVHRTRIEHDSTFDMAWLFDKVHRTFPVFRPDFGFADTRDNAIKNMKDDPRRRVFPVMLYGPAMTKELGGREHLLEAPAWRVEELGDGSLWLQVAENPFKASEKELVALADYLGLEVRGV